MSVSTVFHGTREEGMELTDAIAHNCACAFDGMGKRTVTCGPHDMLLNDQQTLDRLLFYRRITACLRQEEFSD